MRRRCRRDGVPGVFRMGQLILILVAAVFVFLAGEDFFATNPAFADGGLLTGLLVVGGVVLSIGLGLLLHRIFFGGRRRSL
jgi:hypothetical protein